VFDYIFKELRDQFGSDGNVYQTSPKDWKTKATDLLASLSIEMDYLFWTAKAVFSDEIFSHSQTDCLYPTKPHPCVCNVQLKPREDQSKTLGMSFEATLHTGYTGAAAFAQPDVFFELDFWGEAGLQPLRSLHRNHRRVVELMSKGIEFELETNCPIDRLEKFRGRDVWKKLDLYFAGPDEEDVILTLTSEFRVDAKPEVVIRTFLVFIAIYDSCYHYARNPRTLDRILTYYNKLT